MTWIKDFFSKTIITGGAPIGGGIIAFFEQSIPILAVISIITGIVLGILSYRLKVKKYKRDEEKD